MNDYNSLVEDAVGYVLHSNNSVETAVEFSLDASELQYQIKGYDLLNEVSKTKEEYTKDVEEKLKLAK